MAFPWGVSYGLEQILKQNDLFSNKSVRKNIQTLTDN